MRAQIGRGRTRRRAFDDAVRNGGASRPLGRCTRRGAGEAVSRVRWRGLLVAGPQRLFRLPRVTHSRAPKSDCNIASDARGLVVSNPRDALSNARPSAAASARAGAVAGAGRVFVRAAAAPRNLGLGGETAHLRTSRQAVVESSAATRRSMMWPARRAEVLGVRGIGRRSERTLRNSEHAVCAPATIGFVAGHAGFDAAGRARVAGRKAAS